VVQKVHLALKVLVVQKVHLALKVLKMQKAHWALKVLKVQKAPETLVALAVLPVEALLGVKRLAVVAVAVLAISFHNCPLCSKA
jgi:hypothetical protein